MLLTIPALELLVIFVFIIVIIIVVVLLMGIIGRSKTASQQKEVDDEPDEIKEMAGIDINSERANQDAIVEDQKKAEENS